ncbi:MAG: 2-(1,2-epoxy-1,2-dihydrophenyl)acetyl-CoA isomerase [Elusimicrobia bacterium]|nr:MAG: 2-(1,2-epoxy-1,2-dihydrophenyl)acetyl-CoA isomerase [Elusimicrobiota bacterium]
MADTATETKEDELLAETENGVLTITLNRPQVLNSLTRGMMKALRSTLKKAGQDPEVRVIIITGSGRAFCAGADLGDLKALYEAGTAPPLGDELRKYFNPMIRQIRAVEKPVIAVINGLAAGAGASLALACDLKLCVASAKFISAFIQVGLIPDSGFSHMLTHSMGLGLALEHAWTAKPITASRAEHFGMVNKVVAVEDLDRALEDIVESLLAAPPKALGMTKRLMNAAMDRDFDAQLEYEAQIQEILGRTEDHLEGVNAFLESRKPKFTGN